MAIWQCPEHITAVQILLSGSSAVQALSNQAQRRMASGLRPRTLASYAATFNLYLAFVVYMELQSPRTLDTIVLYLEYVAQRGLKACSLRNHVAVLKHYFCMFGWSLKPFDSRKSSVNDQICSNECTNDS